MKKLQCTLRFLLALCLTLSLSAPALASTFTDAHGNEIELDDSLEAYANEALLGAEDAARKAETNLGDLWADALRWFAVSGNINAAFDEDDVKAGNDKLDVDAEHVVALWNAGNLRANIPAGKFGAAELAEVLPYPNKVAVVYMTGAQLAEALEAASQGLPYTEESAAACASFMQVSGLSYTVDLTQEYDKGEAYGDNWFKAASLRRVTITDMRSLPAMPITTAWMLPTFSRRPWRPMRRAPSPPPWCATWCGSTSRRNCTTWSARTTPPRRDASP